MNGVQTIQETARYSDNLLNSFANFNSVFSWNIVSGGANVGTILNSSTEKYAGLYAIKVPFIGTSEAVFNSGSSQMEKLIFKGGIHLLSYRFYKDDVDAEIIVKVQCYVNGILFTENTLEQTLSTTNGFVDGQWNTFYQEITLADSDVVDFAFSVQSDTTACNLYIDGLKLEKNDRGLSIPSVYSEVPIEVIEQENEITIPIITAGSSYVVTFDLQGATLTDSYVSMKYPTDLITQNLLVGFPTITANDVGKFIVFNPTGSSSTAITDGIFNFKVVR